VAHAHGILRDKAWLERDESTANVMSLSDLVNAAHKDDGYPDCRREENRLGFWLMENTVQLQP